MICMSNSIPVAKNFGINNHVQDDTTNLGRYWQLLTCTISFSRAILTTSYSDLLKELVRAANIINYSSLKQIHINSQWSTRLTYSAETAAVGAGAGATAGFIASSSFSIGTTGM